MKNFLLFSLLAVSLGANAWLLTSRSTLAPTPGDATEKSSASSSTRRAGANSSAAADTANTHSAATREPFIWKNTGSSNESLRELAGQLRAAGFPNDVVVRFVGEMLRERTYAAAVDRPFWELMSPGKEARKQMNQAARELMREQEEILGSAGTAVATLDPLQRSARFGSLNDDKVAALLRIDRDYQEMRSDLYGNSGIITSEEVKARQEQQRTMEKERLADITAALSPEEFADWERRESGNAKSVMYALRDLSVSEEEYTALLAAQKARSPNGSPFGVISFDDSSRDPTATYAFMDNVRTTLGEERANTYLKSADFSYAQAANFVEKHPEVPAAKTFDLYKIQTEAQALMTANRSTGSGTPPSQATREQTQKGMAELNTRLDTLLGPTAAEAYRSQGMGSVLRAFTPRPAPKAPAPTKP